MALAKHKVVRVISSYALSILILSNTFGSFTAQALAHPNEYFSQYGDNALLAASFTNEVMSRTSDIYVLDNANIDVDTLVSNALVSMSTPSMNLKTVADRLKFTDVPDDAYYADSVYKLVDLGAIAGYGNGKFGPMDNMTRSQYVKVVIAATVGQQPKGENHILENYMVKAFQMGIVTQEEFPTDTWDNPITREDMALVLVRTMEKVLKENRTSDTSPYTATIADFHTYSDKYKDFIGQAYSKGLLAGYTDGRYGGKDPMIRAQACATVVRLIDPSKRANPKIENPATPWSDQEFDDYMNGVILGIDDTLADTISTSMFGGARFENGLIYWETSYNKFELLPESIAPNINKTVYKAVKNLVYNAYINGGTVCLSTTGLEGDYSGESPYIVEKVAHIAYRGRKLTEMDKLEFNQPHLRMDYNGYGQDWMLSIPFEPKTKFAMKTVFFEHDKEVTQRVADFQNTYKGSYKFHWTIGRVYGWDYYDRVLKKLKPEEYYNPIDGVHSEFFRQFVKDIYGTSNGEAMYKYIEKTLTDAPNTPKYRNYTHNSPSNTSFSTSTAVGGLARHYFYTGY